ncbi:MAG: hypothetical protein JWM98_947 [Thermoleophilia bacterium]|nr:hypothetical protein [Thermoleophilia bacterium]
MGAAMVSSTILRALALARGSWRAQLAVLAVGALVLGVLTEGASSGDGDPLVQGVLAVLATLLLVAASVRVAAVGYEEVNEELFADEFATLAPMVPRLVVHGGVCIAPLVGSIAIVMLAADVHPLLGLVALPVAFVASLATAAPTMLAIAAVLHGERGWLPRGAVAAVRRAPLRLGAAALGGGAAAVLPALPIVLVGLLVSTLGGWIGTFGSGLAFAAAVPGWGCIALALWQVAEVEVDVAPAPVAADAHELAAAHAAQVEASAVRAPSFMVPASPVVDPGEPAWVEGPSWDVALEPAAPWGTWVQLEAAANVALRVTWTGASGPHLAVATEAGAWTQLGVPAAPGASLVVALAAGNTYVQATTVGATAQAVTVTMLVAPLVVAA